MRARTILAAAFLAGISIACSKPASDSQDPRSANRQINLIATPSPDAPVVSALEAGRATELIVGRATPANSGQSRMIRRIPGQNAGTAAAHIEEAPPSIAVTEMASTASVIAPTTSLPMPAVSGSAPAAVAVNNEVRETYGGYTPPSLGARGPMILIRGGMGAPDDDCKLHPTRGRGYGIAVNNVAAMPGRVAVENRLPRGGTGFTRIR
jgi:hypothetical protein